MYSTNVQPESEVRGSLPLINPSLIPKGEGFISGKLLITEDEGCRFVECTVVTVVLMIYYGDITLGCRDDYVTIKTTYNYVLYLFVDSLTWLAPALVDLKVTMVLHLIDEFKFQQMIHEKEEFVPL